RVVVVLAVVEDPAHTGTEQEVALGQDLVPERFHLGHLGEEAVAAEVEAPAVAQHGPADAPHHVVGLEDDRALAPLGQLVGGGQPSGTRARDDDGGFFVHPGRILAGYGTEIFKKAKRAYPARQAPSSVSTVRSTSGCRQSRAATMVTGKALSA